MSNDNTQITPIQGYDTKRMVFSEPISGTIPDSKPKIEFKRINISTKNEDGSTGELILPTTRLFSFGVSENTSQETGKVNGYTFPLCLWNKDCPTEEEKTAVSGGRRKSRRKTRRKSRRRKSRRRKSRRRKFRRKYSRSKKRKN